MSRPSEHFRDLESETMKGEEGQPRTFEEVASEVESLLRAMRLWKPTDGQPAAYIPYKRFIPSIARQLVSACGLSEPETPKANSLQRLRALASAASNLAADRGLAAQLPLETRVALIKVAHAAVPLRILGTRGAPKKEVAANIADILAWHFFGLTGLQPSGSDDGPYVSYLGEVYATLRIKADPVNQAKRAVQRVKKNGPIWEPLSS